MQNNQLNTPSIHLDNLLQTAVASFQQGDSSILGKHKKITYFKKRRNEYRLRKLTESLIKALDPYLASDYKEITSEQKIKIKALVTTFILAIDERKLLFDRPFLRFFLDQGYLDVAEAFMLQAQTDDASLKGEDVFQAMRNVWIMNSLQLCWDIPLSLTPPIYAYSMLYPYTDNFLDNPSIPRQAKELFSKRLNAVLRGEEANSNSAKMDFISGDESNPDEKRVFELIDTIETAYPRNKYPQVFEAILLISLAQEKSLAQDESYSLSREECLNLSFFKGGSSVLADAFLVQADLTPEQMRFSFEYGTFLQLIDDLQDAIVDRANGQKSLFTDNRYADEDVLRLIAYIDRVNESDVHDRANMSLIKEVIAKCSLTMIMDAVGRNPGLISPALYRQVESYAMVRLSFFAEFEAKVSKLMEKLS